MKKPVYILSTKLLEADLFANLSNINLIAMNFIELHPQKFDIEKVKTHSKNWIITSKNSIKILLDKFENRFLKQIHFYCVGATTTQLLENETLNVIASRPTASELGKIIINDYSNQSFTYLCGTKRRHELPELLNQNNISFNEVHIYNTSLNTFKVEKKIDGILFFSPSAIESYYTTNPPNNTPLFCIGETTANTAKKYSENIYIAKQQTIESVIELAKTHFI